MERKYIMKYKILINGGENIAVVKDFFQFNYKNFSCVSTSDAWFDVLSHFEFFKPDAYVVFLDSAYSDLATQIVDVKRNEVYNGAPIIVVGKGDECWELKRLHPELVDLYIRRPITSDNIALSITAFLEKGNVQVRDSSDKKRILVVDDDRTILKMIKAALEDQYEVTAMLNGSLVEKFLSTNEVDLIILDYEMPFMTGADIFRKLKEDKKNSKIPVCFLTGVSEREKVQEIMALRPRGYLLKPLNIDMLMATISNLA